MPLEIWDPQGSPWIKMWLYGATGVGKTVLASTAPKPIFIDLEHGMLSVKRAGVGRWPVSNMADFRECMNYIVAGEHEFETVVVDSLNLLLKIVSKDVVTTYAAGSNGVGRRNYGNMPNQGDWGAILSRFVAIIEAMLGLPYNMILISRTSGAIGPEQRVQPVLSGKNTVSDITGLMDAVGYMYLQEGAAKGQVHREITFDSVTALTKDRSGNLPSVLRNPTWETIAAAWSGDPLPETEETFEVEELATEEELSAIH